MLIKRILKYLLILTKYILIFFLLATLFFIISFSFVKSKINYTLPNNISYNVYDIDGKEFFSITNSNKQRYVKLEDINQNIIESFLSIEDKRFYDHKGIDGVRIFGALLSNVKEGYFKEGASTITQQYVRNLYLDFSKDIKRKLNEALIAIDMENNLSKDEILEGYLNTIYFGHGIYGIYDACQFYFQKNPIDITINEACALASIPKGPTLYSPLNDFEKNDARRKLVLKELYKDNKITKETYDKLYNEKITLNTKSELSKLNLSGFYEDIIINEFKNLTKDIDITKYENIKIYSNCNLGLYKDIEQIIITELGDLIDTDIELSMMVIDSNTKKCLVSIGSKNYNKSSYNRAIKSLRQPASCVKPFLYYKALENGFTPITTINSSPTTFRYGNETYQPQNFNGIYPNCDVTMAYAISTSDNIYALKTHMFLGCNTLCDFLKELNFTSNIKPNLSLALGTSEVYLDELTNAYSTLASLGKIGKTTYIDKIEGDGKIIYQNKYETKQLLDKSLTYILNETMTNVFDNNLSINISVTGNYIKDMINHKYAAKSGSTDFDNYMIGFNNCVTVSVWCGYDDNLYVDNSKTKFIKRIWARTIEAYMNKYVNSSGWYETPDDVISYLINPTYGKATYNNLYRKKMYFKCDNIPWNVINGRENSN